tara:strand:+ start:1158 stop:1562 length:405 start_codon:yes stop_codon:yes gene_type:complete
MKSISIVLTILLISACSVIETHQDWGFMQRVGGLTVAGQDKNPNWLIVRGDVSGFKYFSVKPTQVNSALALKYIEAEIKESTIELYVVTTLISDKYNRTEINGVDISGIKKGEYLVRYLNPDNSTVDLKKVSIY